ncbi:YPL191C-like protein [Saccharomyces cerevisiae x Saccharomyces kudriavzevii VIN7]|uniref:YPL191C-like protein n=1 Tax=Saccharomyces cerevisiae x Saccharomyces kudriavzevii (strain VIN7) TaxID=1095631 RepID=H0H1V8_SACCK|nr:YPL191C-like protein [Saccharomyces cerevisiae x Saccharomyces kudriavzevii VIN7]
MDLNFTTKSVEINGQNHRILLQNENGPCALLALANVLILSQNHTQFSHELIKLVNKRNGILLRRLIEVLADIGLQLTDKAGTDISELLTLLPQLHKGLNINPEFNGFFENSKEMAIFRLFNVDLVHGWVINDSINKTSNEKLSHYSYESAQRTLMQAADITSGTLKEDNSEEILEEAIHIRSFLNESPTQLTDFGLQQLREKLPHCQYSVLFRNDHFSTLYKYKDQLYTLVTDFGYKNCKEIVWQSLNSVNGSGDVFYAGDFSCAKVDEQELPDEVGHTFGAENLSLEEALQIENDKELAKNLQQQEQERVTKLETKRKNRHPKKNLQMEPPVKKETFKEKNTFAKTRRSETPKRECIVM